MDSISYSEMEASEVSEVDIVKGQLASYQALNSDLSKKVQEYKVNLNAGKAQELRNSAQLKISCFYSS